MIASETLGTPVEIKAFWTMESILWWSAASGVWAKAGVMARVRQIKARSMRLFSTKQSGDVEPTAGGSCRYGTSRFEKPTSRKQPREKEAQSLLCAIGFLHDDVGYHCCNKFGGSLHRTGGAGAADG